MFDLLKISNSFVQAITFLHSTNSVLLLFFLHFTPNHPRICRRVQYWRKENYESTHSRVRTRRRLKMSTSPLSQRWCLPENQQVKQDVVKSHGYTCYSSIKTPCSCHFTNNVNNKYCGIIIVNGGPMSVAFVGNPCPRIYIPTNVNKSFV